MDLAGLGEPHRRLMLELLQHGPLRRRDLARRMSLSGGSITRLTKPLEEKGLVVATSQQVNATGRPVHVIDAVLPADTIVGVSLTSEAVRVVRTDLRARILDDVAAPLELGTHVRDRPAITPEAVVAQIGRLVGSLPPRSDVALGLGVSGTVRDGRTVVRSPFLRWRDVDLAGLVERDLGLRCVLANDIAAVALAEAWFGVGREASSFLVLTFGTGVGGAAVVRGVVQDAEEHGVGLLGHLPLVWPDGALRRANMGLTDAGLVALARSYGSAATSPDEVEAGVDEAARRASDEFAFACGALTATGAAFLVPDAVVVLGERSGLVAAHRAAFDAGVASAREGIAPPLSITIRQHNRDVWARGAAVTALVAHVSAE